MLGPRLSAGEKSHQPASLTPGRAETVKFLWECLWGHGETRSLQRNTWVEGDFNISILSPWVKLSNLRAAGGKIDEESHVF